MVELNSTWKRNFDVYDRIRRLGIDLGQKEDSLPPPGAQNLAQATFTPSGLIFLSGTTAGMGAVTDDDAEVEEGAAAAREAGIAHIRVLHWGLHPQGTLNDVWYCVKGLGMVNSAGGGVLTLSHLVVNGYSKVFHDVFGGPLSQFAEDGRDQSLSGWHARSAVGGFRSARGSPGRARDDRPDRSRACFENHPGEGPSCVGFEGGETESGHRFGSPRSRSGGTT